MELIQLPPLPPLKTLKPELKEEDGLMTYEEVGIEVTKQIKPTLNRIVDLTKKQLNIIQKQDLRMEQFRIDTRKITEKQVELLKELGSGITKVYAETELIKKQVQEQQTQQKDTGMDTELKQRIGALEQSLNKGIDNALGQINARMDGVRARLDTVGVRIEEIIPSEPETTEEEPEKHLQTNKEEIKPPEEPEIMDAGTEDTSIDGEEQGSVPEDMDTEGIDDKDDGVPEDTADVDTQNAVPKEGVDTQDPKIDSEEEPKEQPKVTDRDFLIEQIKNGKFESYRQFQEDEQRPISRGKTARIVKKFIEEGKVQREEYEAENTSHTQYRYVWIS